MPRMIVDCDPGHDDAIALILAHEYAEVVGVTTVAGNAPLSATTANALMMMALLGVDTPVHSGASEALAGPAPHAQAVHGSSGLGGVTRIEHDRTLAGTDAVGFLLDAPQRDDWIVALGPLTNLALAIERDPDWVRRVAGISIMGGSAGVGNVTRVAEFNIWADPEAADVVFRSGVPIRMVGLNVTRQVPATPSHRRRIRALGTRTGRAVAELLDFYSEQLALRYGLPGASMHDPLAVSALADPQVLRFESMQVDIELSGEHTYGMTVCDRRHLSTDAAGLVRQRDPFGRPNAEVAVAVDPERFRERFISVLASYP